MKHLLRTANALLILFFLLGCATHSGRISHKVPDESLSAGEATDVDRRQQSQGASLQEPREGTARYNPLPDKVSMELSNEQSELKAAYENGEWAQVIAIAEQIEALSQAKGSPMRFSTKRAEAHIALGHPEEAVRIYREEVQSPGHDGDLTYALALAMTDQYSAEDARALLLSKMGENAAELEHSVAVPNSRGHIVATVRTARAVDGNGPDSYIEREAREALRLNPTERRAALVLAEVLNRQDRYAEALPYWQQASSLPGSAGKRAKEMARSTQHVLERRSSSPQANGSGN